MVVMPTGLAPRIPALRGRFPAVRRRHHGKMGGEFLYWSYHQHQQEVKLCERRLVGRVGGAPTVTTL